MRRVALLQPAAAQYGGVLRSKVGCPAGDGHQQAGAFMPHPLHAVDALPALVFVSVQPVRNQTDVISQVFIA